MMSVAHLFMRAFVLFVLVIKVFFFVLFYKEYFDCWCEIQFLMYFALSLGCVEDFWKNDVSAK